MLLSTLLALCVLVAAGVGEPTLARFASAGALGVAVLGPFVAASAGRAGPAAFQAFAGAMPWIGATAVAAGGAGLGVGVAVTSAVPLLVWAGSAVLVGDVAGRRWGARRGGVFGALLMLCVWGLDLAAELTPGALGFALDLVRPGRAFAHASVGALDLRDGLSLLMLPAGAALLGRRASLGRAAASPTVLRNATLRAVLVPCVLFALLLAVQGQPILLDLSRGGEQSLREVDRRQLDALEGTLVFQILAGGPLDRSTRAALRALDDWIAQVAAGAPIPATVEHLDPTREPFAKALAERLGIAMEPGAGVAALVVRNLERVAVLQPIPAPHDQLAALLDATRGPPSAPASAVALVGGEAAGLVDEVSDLAVAPLTEASLLQSLVDARASGRRPAPVVLLLDPREPPTAAVHWLIDQHVMAGGSLGLFAGASSLPLRPLMGPWGLSMGDDVTPGTATVPKSDVLPGLARLRIPEGVAATAGPEGLVTTAARRGEQPVLMALEGTIPSSIRRAEGPQGAPESRTGSQGAVRMMFGSAALLRANPGTLASAVDWLLDRRPTPPRVARPPSGLVSPSAALASAAVAGAAVGWLSGLGLLWGRLGRRPR